jgi:hypothetical protein
MGQARPASVGVAALIELGEGAFILLVGLGSIVFSRFAAPPTNHDLFRDDMRLLDEHHLAVAIVQMIAAAVMLASGVGALRRQHWARKVGQVVMAALATMMLVFGLVMVWSDVDMAHGHADIVMSIWIVAVSIVWAMPPLVAVWLLSRSPARDWFARA